MFRNNVVHDLIGPCSQWGPGNSKITTFQTIPAKGGSKVRPKFSTSSYNLIWLQPLQQLLPNLHLNKKHLNIINLYSLSDSKLVFNPKKHPSTYNSYISSWCPKCNHNFRPIHGEVTHSCFPSSGQQFNRLGSLAPQTTCQLDILKVHGNWTQRDMFVEISEFLSYLSWNNEDLYMYIICIVQM